MAIGSNVRRLSIRRASALVVCLILMGSQTGLLAAWAHYGNFQPPTSSFPTANHHSTSNNFLHIQHSHQFNHPHQFNHLMQNASTSSNSSQSNIVHHHHNVIHQQMSNLHFANGFSNQHADLSAVTSSNNSRQANYMHFLNMHPSYRPTPTSNWQHGNHSEHYHHLYSLNSNIKQMSPNYLWSESPGSHKAIFANTSAPSTSNGFLAFHTEHQHGSQIGYLSPGNTNNNGGIFSHNNNQPITVGTTSNGSLLGDANISNAFGLNLNSSKPEIAANFNTAITIGGHLGANDTVVQGTTMVIHQGQMLTAAQYAAAEQVLTSGQQTLVLSHNGIATGGLLTLEQGQTSSLSSLAVSRNVTVLAVGYNASNALEITGSARVGGTLDIVQSAANTGSVVDFGSLSVGRSGSVSDALSSNLTSNLTGANNIFSSSALNLNATNLILNLGSINTASNLSLNAGGNISNQGSIVSTGNIALRASGTIANISPTVNNAANNNSNLASSLSNRAPPQATISGANLLLASGAGEFTNTGTITATSGNVTLTAPSAQNIAVKNTGGVIQANQGTINLRDANYSGAASISANGGNWFSQQLNINDASGAVTGTLGQVTGVLNVTAQEAHFGANTPNLITGKMNIAGDPVFFNNSGSVTIASGDFTAGNPTAIIAETNIITPGSAVSITTGSSSALGGAVTMIAGATYNNSTGAVTAAATGGYIDLSGSLSGGAAISAFDTSTTQSGSAGGNVTLIAYAGSGGSTGQILVPSGVTITTGGAGLGTNGNVTMIAGGTGYGASASINIGSINTSGGTGGGGNVIIATATPGQSAGGVIINTSTGAISSGNFQSAGTPTGSGSIWLTGNITTGGGNVAIASSEDIQFDNNNNITTSGGAITLVAGAAFSTPSAGNILNLSGGSPTGGQITLNSTGSFTLSSSTSSGNTNGGNVIITAFYGTGDNAGLAFGPNDIPQITSGGFGSGINGNITMMAGSSPNLQGYYPSMSVGIVDTTGGTGGGGTVIIATATPGVTTGGITINNSGAISSGNFQSTGTPTGSGSSWLYGNITTGGANVTIASSDSIILANNGLSINTNGGAINLIAGASFDTPSSGILHINGASNTGGAMEMQTSNWTFTLSTVNSNTNGSGGNITLIAFSGSEANTLPGDIFRSGVTAMATGGNGSGSNGNIIALAGAENAGYYPSISPGVIDTSGGTGGVGNVIFATVTPGFTAGGVTINSNGAISSGNFLGVGTPTGSASVWLNGNINTAGGNVTIASSDTIRILADGLSINTNGGAINLIAGASFDTPSSGVLHINGASATGGAIDTSSFGFTFTLSSANSNTNGSGGNITLIASTGAETNVTPGDIFGAAFASAITGGSGTGSNGSLIAISGSTDQGTGASLSFGSGTINTAGGTGGGGSVTLATATPGVTSGGVTINSSGAISSGSFQSTGTPTGSASISIDTITTGGGNVTLASSEDIQFNVDTPNVITTAGGALNLLPAQHLVLLRPALSVLLVVPSPADELPKEPSIVILFPLLMHQARGAI